VAFLLKERFVKNKGQKTAIIEKQRQNIAGMLDIISEVEDTAVQLKMGILTCDRLRDEKDKIFRNKLERYFYLRTLTRLFLFYLLDLKDIVIEPQDANVEIVEQIFRFKKHFF